MIFIVYMHLRVSNTYKIRQRLYNEGFKLLLLNKHTLERTPIEEDYSKDEESITPINDGSFIIECIYNSKGKMPSFIGEMMENPKVELCRVEYRQRW